MQPCKTNAEPIESIKPKMETLMQPCKTNAIKYYLLLEKFY